MDEETKQEAARVPEINQVIFAMSVAPDGRVTVTRNGSARDTLRLVVQALEDLREQAWRDTLAKEAKRIIVPQMAPPKALVRP